MLYLPKGLPAIDILKSENALVGVYEKGHIQDVVSSGDKRTLRILFLNLMPQKLVTELDITRMLAHPELSVQLIPMKISGQTYKTTPMQHMEDFYTDFEELEVADYDGMILTGAPIEHLPFEEVRYWPQLCHIMQWAETHVRSTLYICWGAQAGLQFHYGIPKYQLPAKMFGIYSQRVLKADLPLLRGLSPAFPMPNSRHTEVRRDDFPNDDHLQIVAENDISGVGLAIGHNGREIYIVGHLEYEPNTLRNEYVRDVNKGLPIAKPANYFVEDNPEKGVDFSWKDAARTFYHNWLEAYCDIY